MKTEDQQQLIESLRGRCATYEENLEGMIKQHVEAEREKRHHSIEGWHAAKIHAYETALYQFKLLVQSGFPPWE